MEKSIDRRQTEQELLAAVVAGRHELPIRNLCRLLQFRLQKLQAALVRASETEFLPIQAEARAVAKLLLEITIPE